MGKRGRNTGHKHTPETRKNLTDWLRLCATCHKNYDKKVGNYGAGHLKSLRR